MPTRLLREGILESARVDALTAEEEVFYRRLMSVADDYGRCEANSQILRSKLFPLRVDSIPLQQIEAWLAACSETLAGEEEPLVTVFIVGRKKFLQINGFGQRLRYKSKFPDPPREREKRNSNSQTKSDQVRQSPPGVTTPSLSHSPLHLTSPLTPPLNSPSAQQTAAAASEAAAPESSSGDGAGFDYRAAFDQVADEYPAEGRDCSKQTQAVFAATVASEHQVRKVPQGQVVSEIIASIRRWRSEDFRWQTGRVHLLRNFLADGLFRQNPLPAIESRARSPGRSNGRAAARRELLKSVTLEREEKHASH